MPLALSQLPAIGTDAGTSFTPQPSPRLLSREPVYLGPVRMPSRYFLAPLAGYTNLALRRTVRELGGLGLATTDLVNARSLVERNRKSDELIATTPDDRPTAVQIFGSEPQYLAEAARLLVSRGYEHIDINMGCPVHKVVKGGGGSAMMCDTSGATVEVVRKVVEAVKIPVTVKMRAGWNDKDRNAPTLARMVEDAGAAAVAVHGRTAEQSYSGSADWELVEQVADALAIPVFGSGDCVEPRQAVERLRSGVDGVLVGRGVLRNPWILAQAADLDAGRPAREVTPHERGRFLLDYIDLLLEERLPDLGDTKRLSGHARWVINKLRALGSYYTRGLDNGSHLRTAINSAESLDALRETISTFFIARPALADSSWSKTPRAPRSPSADEGGSAAGPTAPAAP